MYKISLSVRSLVEFLYQSGDLVFTASSIERANLGSQIHRMLQAQATGDYESEVYLSLQSEVADILFKIDGRADGILKEEDRIIIEEIKSTYVPYHEINDQHFVHFAQAYCYGHMYCQAHELDYIDIRLTYYQIDTKQIKSFTQTKTSSELESFYLDTLQNYLKWAFLRRDLQAQAITTLQDLTFPFDTYREGQRTFAVAVYKTILDKDVLFAQAPTGIGKTISTLFPALKAIGEKKIEKIFYLCAKNITARVAYDTIGLLYLQGVRFKTVGLVAKDKICFLEERNCDPKHCPYANGYYDRVNDALYELLETYDFIDQEHVCEIAKQHTICPFELSLDASLYADVIIGDYNYTFDPRVYLKRFFTEKGNYLFLIDEAHNLVDRAREMYSAELTKSSFLQIKRLIPKEQTLLLKSISMINRYFIELRKECETQQIDFLAHQEQLLPMKLKLTTFIELMDAYLQSEHDITNDDELKDVYFQCTNYIKIAEFYDAHFVTWRQITGNDIMVKQYCMNPSSPLKETLKKGKAAVFFSATLSPIDYYLSLLGGSEDTKRLALPSPFQKEQLKFIIHDQISTKYKDRAQTIPAIVELIYVSIQARHGNYIVFFPSYQYMNQIVKAFQDKYQDVFISIQDSGMQEQEKQDFLNQFNKTDELHLHFCVLGGMFSEGIDLKGDKLIGVIIIGIGLPQLNPQQDLIKDHFNEINQMGFSYAYQFPGMNKVLQAAGRVIRSHEDKGMLLFIDERYTSYRYRNLLPMHMQHFEIVNDPQTLQHSLETFWKDAS